MLRGAPSLVRASLLCVVAVALASCGDGGEPDAGNGVETASGAVDASAVNVGDCLEELPGDADQVTQVSAVPCDEPHAAEVYAQFDLEDDDEYPGDDEVSALADEGCATRFEAFVGIAYDASRLEIGSLYPTSESWDTADDREVSCLLTDPEGPLTGSAEGLGEATAIAPPTPSEAPAAGPTPGSCVSQAGDVVDCAVPHDGELFAVVTLPDGAWPGQEGVDSASEQGCVDQFAAYVGVPYEQSALDIAFVTPDEASWAAGDRESACIAVDPAGQLTGSVRGSGR